MTEPPEPAWVTYDQTIAIHSRQLRRFGGAPGLRDDGLLQSALQRPVNKWQYENAELPGSALDKEASFNLLREVLPKLPPREAAILRLRFGLEGGVEKTLEEIGTLMRLTRERIRQLQNVALLRLRRLMEDRDCITTMA